MLLLFWLRGLRSVLKEPNQSQKRRTRVSAPRNLAAAPHLYDRRQGTVRKRRRRQGKHHHHQTDSRQPATPARNSSPLFHHAMPHSANAQQYSPQQPAYPEVVS